MIELLLRFSWWFMFSSWSVLIWFSGLLAVPHPIAVCFFFWWAVVYVFLVVCSNIIFRVVYASPPWSCAFFFGERSFMISSCSVLIWFSGLLTVPPGCEPSFTCSFCIRNLLSRSRAKRNCELTLPRPLDCVFNYRLPFWWAVLYIFLVVCFKMIFRVLWAVLHLWLT